MHRSRTPRHRRTTLALGIVLAATALTGTGLVAAARTLTVRRADASRAALRDYMEYAVGIASDGAQWDVLRALRARMQISPRGRLFGEPPGTTAGITLDRWASTVADVDACHCLSAIEETGAFRYRVATGRLDLATRRGDSAAVHRWLRDTLAVLVPATRGKGWWIESFSGAHLPGRAMAGRIVDGATPAESPDVFGYVANVRPWIAVAMGDMFERAALFPTALSPGKGNASLVRLLARTSLGDTLYDSGARPGVRARTAPTVTVHRGEFGGMNVDVIPGDSALTLFTRIATPSSGALPILGGLFLLTLAALTVVANRLRREAEVGRRQWTFATSVSHELRTPLAQILLFAERLRDRRRTTHDADEVRLELDVIVRETERMRYLVENVLHVARNEPPSLHVETARVAPIVEEIVDRHASMAESNGVTLVLDVEQDFAAPVDRYAIEQIVLNLLDNAVKHAGPGEVRIGVGISKGRLAIWVDDAGKGIPASERARVWEPFVRGSRAHDDATAGNGLGLSVVRDLVEALGGETAIDTSPAGGARVIVWLARARAMAADEETVA